MFEQIKEQSENKCRRESLQEFYSEKLEELVSLEKSVPLILSVTFKFEKKIVHCKSASNRFQLILYLKGIFGVHFYS